jgi:hypothetical protein
MQAMPSKENPDGARVMQGSLVAGARIRVRDSEWVVAHVDRSATSGAIVHATGLSGIVRDKEAIFIEAIEKARGRGIEVVEPSKNRSTMTAYQKLVRSPSATLRASSDPIIPFSPPP